MWRQEHLPQSLGKEQLTAGWPCCKARNSPNVSRPSLLLCFTPLWVLRPPKSSKGQLRGPVRWGFPSGATLTWWTLAPGPQPVPILHPGQMHRGLQEAAEVGPLCVLPQCFRTGRTALRAQFYLAQAGFVMKEINKCHPALLEGWSVSFNVFFFFLMICLHWGQTLNTLVSKLKV